MLTAHRWPLCAAFTVEGHTRYLFVNESAASSSRCDWAVIKLPSRPWYSTRVINGVCFNVMSLEESITCIKHILAGADDSPIFRVAGLRLETAAQHACPFCIRA